MLSFSPHTHTQSKWYALKKIQDPPALWRKVDWHRLIFRDKHNGYHVDTRKKKRKKLAQLVSNRKGEKIKIVYQVFVIPIV
jgi:hypothetical protein